MISYESILGYLLSVTGVPGSLPPSRVWDTIPVLAERLRISFFLAGLIGECPHPDIPEKVVKKYRCDLSANIARNAVLSLQIRSIAQLFSTAGIPCMFFKGGACLVRGLYPSGWRFMTDIDILVHRKDRDRSLHLLETAGYCEKSDGVEQVHHLPPLSHPIHPGEVELHTTPYPLGEADERSLNELWSHAEIVLFMETPILVPGPTDHVWIMVRTDTIERVTIPRLPDIIEYSLIRDCKLTIDHDVLVQRAEHDRMPNLIRAFFYGVESFADGNDTRSQHDSELLRWEESSRIILRKELRCDCWHSSRRRWLAVRFLPPGGLKSRTVFGIWLAKEIVSTDRFRPGTFREKPLFLKALIYMKLGILFVVSGFEYLVFYRMTHKKHD